MAGHSYLLDCCVTPDLRCFIFLGRGGAYSSIGSSVISDSSGGSPPFDRQSSRSTHTHMGPACLIRRPGRSQNLHLPSRGVSSIVLPFLYESYLLDSSVRRQTNQAKYRGPINNNTRTAIFRAAVKGIGETYITMDATTYDPISVPIVSETRRTFYFSCTSVLLGEVYLVRPGRPLRFVRKR